MQRTEGVEIVGIGIKKVGKRQKQGGRKGRRERERERERERGEGGRW